ncbi:HPF/RaiA family ribosome-associated protein [Olivibacter sp. SDN3]|uniref:HPF/RaiA family ribosome-associated protein n=1 Tax=Olivibacter sp. SDN3 TaxID=2764720 RepID=UPI0016515BE7|nr:HPF/RaiA family ribosome-associated protein [Olivibacter sp. SDN3]QNL48032.1 HPF/RaiA family ribosome-associated protein [Olivibacter sp. SDN3]
MVTIQVNSDKNINVSENFSLKIKDTLGNSLSRFEEFITRLEVFLADENSDKQGSKDKRCTIEVRIKGLDPEAVTSTADDIDLAFKQATDKLTQLLKNRTEKLKNYS